MVDYFKSYLGLKSDDRAVTALEYALIAGLIALVIIAGVTTLGTHLSGIFTALGSQVTT